MPRSLLIFIAALTLVSATSKAQAGFKLPSADPKPGVQVAPVPDGEKPSELWQIEVDGKKVDAYAARTADPPFDNYDYGGEYAFLQIEATQQFSVRVKPSVEADELTVRPLSYGIKAKRVEDGYFEIVFDKSNKPRQVSIETNGREHPLLLFVNPFWLDPTQFPSTFKHGDIPPENLIYFGEGVHKPEGGVITLGDNQTLYLAPGAVVQAGVVARGKNIHICGLGVLDSTPWKWREGPTSHVVSIEHCQNVTIEGIVIRGASRWTLVPVASENVWIDNVKICGGRVQNDDGINPCNTRHMIVANSFIRTDDDCMAFKGLDNSYGNCADIRVHRCVFWCDRARIVLMGHESRADYMRYISFTHIDVIHAQTRNFLLEPGERMRLEDVYFGNIRFETGVENALSPEALEKMKDIDTKSLRFDIDVANKDNWLFVGRPAVNQYMKTKEPGHMKNIVVRNISVVGPLSYCGILFSGADEEHRTQGLTIENVTLFGEKVDEKSPIIHIGDFIDDVTVQ